MIENAMLSARAIASEVSAGRLDPQQALETGEINFSKREKTLQVYAAKSINSSAELGPLAGIGIGVKDIFDTYDLTTEYGSAIYRGHRPVGDAALVSMLRQAGATLTGKTVTTEFAWFSPGPTRNPHNQEHTPGGSSSGSAAGVAAGYFPAAIGSQTGGSIIRPAAFCGVAGYKPSFRLFPTVGMKQFSWSLDTPGFFAASVADAGFVAGACSGRNLTIDENNTTPPRVGLYQSTIDHMMNKDMASALTKACEMMEDAGGEIHIVKEPQKLEEARLAHAVIQDFEARLSLADEFVRSPEKLTTALRDYLTAASAILPEHYDDARRTANHARKECQSLFGKCDVLLLASAPGTAPHGLGSTGDSIFNRLWTLLGTPTVNVPGLTGKNQLPLGVQIVAPFGKDLRALQAAHWIEQLFHKT